MKKKILILSSFALVFSISACGGSEPEVPNETVNESTLSLEEVVELFTDDLYRKEVYNSSEVSFKEETNAADATFTTHEGTMEIYSDEHASETGRDSIKYEDGSTYNDGYTMYLGIDEVDGQRTLSRITDYTKGDLREAWADSAYTLPILSAADPDLVEGQDYLLEGSAIGQVTYQVSLYLNNFVAGNLLNNVDLVAASLPDVKVQEHEFVEGTGTNYTDYVFDLYEYNYDEDGDTITNGYEFSFRLDEEDRLVEGKTVLHYTQERGEEVYKETTTNTYSLKYETRKASSTSTTLLNREDYFLTKVNEYSGYYYNSKYDKIPVDLNKLPLNQYIWFEASDYAPEKAIDLTLYPVSTSNPEVIEINDENIYTVSGGRATVVFETATGLQIVKDFVVNDEVLIENINFTDVSSGVEYGDNEEGNVVRYIYTDTTYEGIRVSGTPNGAKKDQIKYETLKGDGLFTLTDTSLSDSYYDFTLALTSEAKEGDEISIRFFTESEYSVEYTVTYVVKRRLSVDELMDKLMSSTYRWENLYGESGGVLKFTSETTFEVTYYSDINDESTISGKNAYSFVLNKETNVANVTRVTAEDGSDNTNYDTANISLDGNEISLSVNVTDYVHNYNIVE